MGKTKISSRQFTVLVVLYTVGTTILITPAGLAEEVKQDAWMIPAISFALGILLVLAYSAVGSMFAGKTLVKSMERLWGKWIGKLMALGFIYFSFITSVTLVWYTGNFVTTQFMPETPLVYINLLFVFVIITALRYGIETIARGGEMLLPVVGFLFVLTIFLLLPEVEFENIKPLFDASPKSFIKATLQITSVMTFPLIVMTMVASSFNDDAKKLRKSFLAGYTYGHIIIFFITLFCILVLGDNLTSVAQFPVYVLAKKIDVGDVFDRLEGFVAIIWMITVMFRAILYLYAALQGISDICGLKSYKPLTWPVGLVVLVLSLIIYPNAVYQMEWDSNTWIPFAATFGVALPLTLLATRLLKKQKGDASAH